MTLRDVTNPADDGAIVAGLIALEARLAAAARICAAAAEAMRSGDRHRAIGAMLPLEAGLRCASRLVAVLLDLNRSRPIPDETSGEGREVRS